MKLVNTDIPDCFILESFHQEDHRGGFVKTYNANFFKNAIDFRIKEVYYTWSKPGVFRGFHFQLPPHDHSKVVCCNFGRVIDYVIDLRASSPEYGKPYAFELSEDNRKAIVIPKGCAHGFYVPEEESMLTYLVETEYNTESDSGIYWASFDLKDDLRDPITSERDDSFQKFEHFITPFI